jgi:serine/threonine protein kinase
MMSAEPGAQREPSGKTSGFLPTCPARLPADDDGRRSARLLEVGDRVGDYELLGELGCGGFARVFLARQLSLDRLVALKVSADVGHEARTLARLEHEHIVQVLGVSVDAERCLRLLAIRYEPGATLERVLQRLAGRPFRERGGPALLEAASGATPPNGAGPLADCDAVEAVCWVGARLAEALAWAHGEGVCHRDVKPGNIFLTERGRPRLLDFNVASDAGLAEKGMGAGLGGTLPYMAPEHLDALAESAPRAAVDHRADIYALGIVLFEMATGRHPFPEAVRRDVPPGEALAHLADVRRRGAPSVRAIEPDVPPLLDRIVRRCLEPDPACRYGSAAELAAALEQCREWEGIVREVPAGVLTRWLLRWPLLVTLVLPLLPHILGAAIDTTYLLLWAAAQHDRRGYWDTLVWLLPASIVAVTILTTPLNWLLVAPALRAQRRMRGANSLTAEELDRRRRGQLWYPRAALGLSLLGWLFAALVVPLVIHWRAGPLTASAALHLLLSFAIAGLTALAYCVLAAQFIVLRLNYPAFWPEGRAVRATARVELRGARFRLTVMPMVAVLVPLAAVAAVVVPLDDTPTPPLFRGLIVALILLGGVGSVLAGVLAGNLRRLVAAWTGSDTGKRGEPVPPPGEKRPFLPRLPWPGG